LVKAFLEEKLAIPAVIRLGGNYENLAVQILQTYLTRIRGVVEGYGHADSAEFCAARLAELVRENASKSHLVSPLVYPDFSNYTYRFATMTGEVLIDHRACEACQTKGCIKACLAGILEPDKAGRPVLNISPEEAQKGKCTECLACEIFCKFHEQDAIYVYLPIPGLAEYRQQVIKEQQKKTRRSN
jgi:succinyl-CoA synthetase beta subunit